MKEKREKEEREKEEREEERQRGRGERKKTESVYQVLLRSRTSCLTVRQEPRNHNREVIISRRGAEFFGYRALQLLVGRGLRPTP